ncbi:MAG: rhamnulokinase family protein [Fibrobacterota bacterium]
MRPVHALHFAAVDLGAESGRVMNAAFDGERFTLTEAHRFTNGPVQAGGTLYWDALRLFAEIKQGIKACAQKAPLAGIGVDTWGVDFGLLDGTDELLGNPVHYRDTRTEGMMEKAFGRVPRQEIYECTGLQFLPFNSLYQLLALSLRQPHRLAEARTFLTMPDLLNFWLSGRKGCEFTNATTTQIVNPRTRTWARAMLDKIGIPNGFLPEIISPGTILAPLLPSVAKETGAGNLPVIAPACHDTGSAVAAAPLTSSRSAYISSGTWSLVGVEVDAPVITPRTLAKNFTNEGGTDGRFRLLKNIMGMWLLQECRRTWAQNGPALPYDVLMHEAESAPAFGPLVDPDDAVFLAPGDMPTRLRAYCGRTGQTVPENRPALLRCIFESLALKYRWVLLNLEDIVGWKIDCIHIIGGGSRNSLLCQMTADACGKPVMAGPVEATALGNALMQARALGHIASLAEGREIIRLSVEWTGYKPRPSEKWDTACHRFTKLNTELVDDLKRTGREHVGL